MSKERERERERERIVSGYSLAETGVILTRMDAGGR